MSENAIDSERISKPTPDKAKPKGTCKPGKKTKPAKKGASTKKAGYQAESDLLTLTLEHQAAFVEEAREIFLPIPGGFGRMGHTHIRLAAASEDILTDATIEAMPKCQILH